MSEWWTYHLSDFLMFSPRTYHRLFELYNRDIWPAQLVALALGGLMFARVLLRGRADRLVCGVLAASWCWVSWVFLAPRFSTISTGGSWFALAFGCEGVLLVLFGVARPMAGRSPAVVWRQPGIWILVVALAVEPLIGRVAGRSWPQIELFGVAPDPTVVATLGCLLLTADRTRWLLLTIPVLWCAITGATLWAMHSPDALLPPVVALLVLILALRQRTVDPAVSQSRSGKA